MTAEQISTAQCFSFIAVCVLTGFCAMCLSLQIESLAEKNKSDLDKIKKHLGIKDDE